MTSAIRVLLADDHPLVRAGIAATLSEAPGVVIVGEASDGHTVRHLSQECHPDVLLLDVRMPGPVAVETVAWLRAHCPQVKVLVLTAHDEDAYVRGLITAGIAGYVLKDEAREVIIHAIRSVALGNTWFSQPIVAKMLCNRVSTRRGAGIAALTDREIEVVRLVAAGKANQEIGSALEISEKTVEKYLGAVFTKLAVASRVEVAVRAVREGIV